LLATVLLIILKLPVLAGAQPSRPFTENIQESLTVISTNDTASITFSPVVTLYLPIVLVPPPAPVISNISYTLISPNDSDCDSGDLYEVAFDYTDRNGNANLGYIETKAVFSPSGQVFDVPFPTTTDTPNGFKGKAFFYPCISFGSADSQVNITVVLVDEAGLKSNPLTITIP
jgi:hypothetical protein